MSYVVIFFADIGPKRLLKITFNDQNHLIYGFTSLNSSTALSIFKTNKNCNRGTGELRLVLFDQNSDRNSGAAQNY